MIDTQRPDRPRGDRMTIPRSRGAASGFLLVLLGLWGALVPFIGPNFDFAFTPDQAWTWTTGRGWLEVLPGIVTVLGGLVLLTSRNRATAVLGSWLSVAGGAWFVIGRALAGPLGLGDAGAPVADTETKRVWLDLTFFYGLGALRKGNRVEVQRQDGKVAVFEVYGNEVFAKSDFPGDRVYGNKGAPELRVITCGGGFSRENGYAGNVVVFARMVEVR